MEDGESPVFRTLAQIETEAPSRMFKYPISVAFENDDFVARSRDFPEVLAFGKSADELEREASEALRAALNYRARRGDPIAKPSRAKAGEIIIAAPLATQIKIALIEAWRAAGLNKSELGRRIGVSENEARRILDPDHATNLRTLDAAARALGVRFAVTIENPPDLTTIERSADATQ